MNNSTFIVNIYLIHCSTFELKNIYNALRVIIFQDNFSTFGQKSLTSGDRLAGLYSRPSLLDWRPLLALPNILEVYGGAWKTE